MNQEERFHRQEAYENEAHLVYTVFRWFTDFFKCQSSVLESARRSLSAVILENLLVILKMLILDNRRLH